MEHRRVKCTTKKIVFLVFICIIINFVGALAASLLQLPIRLDFVGTVMAAYFAGPVGAAVAGAAGNLIYYLIFGGKLVFVLAYAILGLATCICIRAGHLEKIDSSVIASLFIGIISVAVMTPFNIMVYNGKTGNFWGDIFFDMLEWYGVSRVMRSIGAEMIVDLLDKQICVIMAFVAIKLILKCGRRENPKGKNISRAAILAIPLLALLVLSYTTSVCAEEKSDNYVETIYDVRSGMTSSEANDIAETEDGYIWIGGYAGLTRYNGQDFELIQENGITSVTCLKADESGNLWIGTNDSGIILYRDGEFTSVTIDDGLPVNSINTFAEASDGSMYVGTAENICKLTLSGNSVDVTVLDNDIESVSSMVMYNDRLVGVTNTGKIFTINNDELKYVEEAAFDSTSFSCISVVGNKLWVGTTRGYAEQVSLNNDKLVFGRKILLGTLDNITCIKEDSSGRVWICADNGIGYVDTGFTLMKIDGFDASIEHICEDYEGNIWFASSHYGVMKICESKFVNIFEKAGIAGNVVNTVTLYDGKYYCGTDTGLVIIDSLKYNVIENTLTKMLENVRVRCIVEDSNENIWICTYGSIGLVRYSKDGSIKRFTNKTDGLTGDRLRCATELSSGVIAVGASSGINFIKGNILIGTLGRDDGLENTQIMSMCEDENGRIYAATNGAGIYIIEDMQIVKHIGYSEGLASDMVLRIVPYNEGYFVVASNALCYMKDDKVQVLDNFPYRNNYDVMILGDYAFVLSSAGIYAVDIEQLLAGEEISYRLFNYDDGITDGITQNSWNMTDNKGKLFFCGNKGVTFFRVSDVVTQTGYFKTAITVELNNGVELENEGDVYIVPASAKTVTVKASVMKYSLSNVKTKFYISGINDEYGIVNSNAVEPIIITNIKQGSYCVHIQIFSDDESTLIQEKTYILKKEAQVWENIWYKLYLGVISVWMVSFAFWIVMIIVNIFRKRKQLEKLGDQLQKKVNEQTEKIRLQADEMEEFQWEVIESMASIIESRDGNTGDHVRNTANYVGIIANEMLRQKLYPDVITQRYVYMITKVAPLHDVGKIKISDMILNKPGKFTEEEYEIMKCHTTYGGEIVEIILGKNADPQMVQIAKDVAYYHHEKWNGTGYPSGKNGNEIPLSARIMAVADVFDALVSKRVYKDAFSIDKAFEIIKEESGKQFDEEIVEVFLSQKEKVIKHIKATA